jgi:hypothetical protein
MHAQCVCAALRGTGRGTRCTAMVVRQPEPALAASSAAACCPGVLQTADGSRFQGRPIFGPNLVTRPRVWVHAQAASRRASATGRVMRLRCCRCCCCCCWPGLVLRGADESVRLQVQAFSTTSASDAPKTVAYALAAAPVACSASTLPPVARCRLHSYSEQWFEGKLLERRRQSGRACGS